MQSEVNEFEWNVTRLEAAQLVAEGSLAPKEIAAKLGIDYSTLWRWEQKPEFAAKVQEHIDEYDRLIRRRGIARLTRRVDAQNDRWRRAQELLAARAADPTMADVPGGNTGLLVRSYKSIGSGESAQVVEEYAFDAALYREMRELEKQAAQELGQWVNKSEVGGTDGGPIQLIEVIRPANADSADEPSDAP